MIKILIKMSVLMMAAGLLASTAYAAPVKLSDTQMDSIAAGGVDKVEGFVCPVIPGKGVVGNDKFFPIGDGFYSFHGPDVVVPVHATNADGTGRPGGNFAAPGDTDYSAVWGFRQ